MRLAERHREPDEAHFTEGELDLEPPEELAVGGARRGGHPRRGARQRGPPRAGRRRGHARGDPGGPRPRRERGGRRGVRRRGPRRPRCPRRPRPCRARPATTTPTTSSAPTTSKRASIWSCSSAWPSSMSTGPELGPVPPTSTTKRRAPWRGAPCSSGCGSTLDLVDVAPRGSDEFVCRSCFLVRGRVQLADPATMACHDCST